MEQLSYTQTCIGNDFKLISIAERFAFWTLISELGFEWLISSTVFLSLLFCNQLIDTLQIAKTGVHFVMQPRLNDTIVPLEYKGSHITMAEGLTFMENL